MVSIGIGCDFVKEDVAISVDQPWVEYQQSTIFPARVEAADLDLDQDLRPFKTLTVGSWLEINTGYMHLWLFHLCKNSES